MSDVEKLEQLEQQGSEATQTETPSIEQKKSDGIVPIYCMVCKTEIPPDLARRKNIRVCVDPKMEGSKYSRCQQIHREMLRALRANRGKRCRSCGAPVSPEEKAEFKAWRRSMHKNDKPRGRPLGSKNKIRIPGGADDAAV